MLEIDLSPTNMEVETKNNKSIEIEAPKTENKVSMDYNESTNKPSINGVELTGNKTTKDLGIEIPEIPEVDLSNHYNKKETDELLAEKEDKRFYAEVNINFNPNTGTATVRDWITENPYQVMDEENKKGREVILKGYLYVNGMFLETVYLTQTIYSEGAYGNFKFFLGFVDDTNMAYLRINANGSSISGLKKFN